MCDLQELYARVDERTRCSLEIFRAKYPPQLGEIEHIDPRTPSASSGSAWAIRSIRTISSLNEPAMYIRFIEELPRYAAR